MPVIGLGTYSVFDLPSEPGAIASSKQIVDALLGAGGSVIDTSPMYNRSETIIGDVVDAGSARDAMFLATKVWTDGRESGIQQMRRSAELMNTEMLDLMQVHNLRDTAIHMATIREWQEEGRIRYSGLTHYRAAAHDALAAEMKNFKPQFIQINYSLGEREADERLLPLAADAGVAVIVNRPYQAGALFRAVGDPGHLAFDALGRARQGDSGDECATDSGNQVRPRGANDRGPRARERRCWPAIPDRRWPPSHRQSTVHRSCTSP